MTQLNLSENSAVRDDAASRFHWKQLYQGALLETDPRKIRARMVEAQIAVLKRSTEILSRPLCREHRELDDAWRFLHLLERDVSSE
jgi:hypothetical protein